LYENLQTRERKRVLFLDICYIGYIFIRVKERKYLFFLKHDDQKN